MFEVDYVPAVVPLFYLRVCINRRLNTESLPTKVLRGPCMNNCQIGPNIKIQAGEMLNLNCDVSDASFEAVMASIRAEVQKRKDAAVAAEPL